MEHKESLRALGLSESSSLQDLTSVFRKLVKKYHPDLNQDRLEWSNRQMLFLNEAYNSAYDFLSRPRPAEAPKTTAQKHEPEIRTAPSHTSNPAFRQGVSMALNYLHDGIGLYYQYGLDNIALRHEGTRRNRFRSSVRRVKKSFSLLKPVADLYLNQKELDQLDTIVTFIRLFYKSMHISLLRAEDNSVYEKKAFRHYEFGSKLVDSIIKEIMFKEFLEPYKLGRLPENIKLAEAEFNSVIIDYSEALCKRQSEVKKELLYTFMDLTDLNDQGIIELY